ncbi:DUF4347 domain-containing protein [Dasania sp. GY-MA-18]|uniref:DUF4347 domain-containing protein n=1 Tax=Dasania phycosphaerae TaxID=2950436 RepID=A0A9J6RIQ6_9GAMM|nr:MULTISPECIES: DUF4347 domain-containing protein [Dasania]MCR8921441.1 DUF4347 domain-containing protein [Dasania sp. GY-MA-18]MCZ0863869.1 DUF4347 domain-containing protein [Dasania phycosphaerae]MCZ0867597.1 DUF4347 domain-containing protein [Dasania phycosphaerae]
MKPLDMIFRRRFAEKPPASLHSAMYSIESLEPRLLMSADPLGAADPSGLLNPLDDKLALGDQAAAEQLLQTLAASYLDKPVLAATTPEPISLSSLSQLYPQDKLHGPQQSTFYSSDEQESGNTALIDELAVLLPTADEAIRQELIFVDTSLEDYQSLLAAIPSNDQQTHYSVIEWQPGEDALAKITSTLAALGEVDAIHIISHGNENGFALGDQWLSSDKLNEYQASLNQWRQFLDSEADLLIYGCELAAGEAGRDLLTGLAAITGADVAASDDLTGASEQGGDWDLEYSLGTVQTSIAFNDSWVQNWQGVLAEPTAVDDAVQTIIDTPVKIDVVANDTDPESDPIVLLDYTNPTNGSVTLNGDNTLTYTPGASYSGGDSFDYLVYDGNEDETSHYWRLDGDAVDAVGGDDGTVVGTTTVAGHYGDALSFDGVDDYVVLPDVNYPTGNFTISFRFQIQSGGLVGSGVQYLYNHGNFGSLGSINIAIREDTHASAYNNHLVTNIKDNLDVLDSSSLYVDISSLNLDDGAWHSYTLVSTNGSGTEVFIDGVSQATSGNGAGPMSIASDIYLGASNEGANNFYGGALDSVRIYNDSLNSTQVSDLHSGGSQQATVNVTVSPNLLWLSTSNDVSSPGANGLASWTDSAVLGFDPDAAGFEPTTSGSFNAVFDLADHTANNNVDAIHYVTTDIDVGSGTPISLLAGDVLLSIASAETLTNSDLSTTDVDKEDVFIFRPDTVGDYSSGTFIKLFTNNTGTDITALTLVEETTTVGDTTLQQGTFLIVENDNSILVLTPGDLTAAPANVGTEVLVDGSDTPNLSDAIFSNNITGLELIENDYTVAGTTLTAGTLLVTTDGDNSVYLSNTQAGTRHDIYALNLTQTTKGLAGITDGTVSLFFDGSKVGLNHGDENIDSFSFIQSQGASNVLPTGNVVIDGTVREDETLTANTSGLSDANGLGSGGYSYQWQRDGASIVGATSSTYTLGDDDVDKAISVVVSYTDGAGNAEVVISSETAAVENVNDEPTLSATATNPTFTEGGAAVNVFSGAVADAIDNGDSFTAMTLTVTNVNDGSDEKLNLDGTAISLTDPNTGTTATNGLDYSVSVTGTTATITLSNGSLDAAATQTLINNISYQNDSDEPDTSSRVVSITSLQDDGGTANGGDDTLAPNLASTVTVLAVNDEPTLTATASNPTFTEGGAAQGLFSAASVDTIESSQTIAAITLTVSNVNDGSDEKLSIDGTVISLTHGNSGTTAPPNSLSYSVSVTGTTATITLSGGSLSSAATQTLVNGISYQNDSDEPDTSNRVVTITELKDNGGVANGGDNTSAPNIASTVTVVSVNDEPTLTVTASNPTFTEDGAAQSLFSSASASTIESTQTFSAMTLTVTNVNNGSDEKLNLDGSTISLTNGNSGTTASSLSYIVTVSGTTATITLSGGSLDAGAIETLIDGISYQNDSDDPTTSNRVVTITSLQDNGGTADGGDDTAALNLSSTVTMVAVNDEPTLSVTASNPTFTEGGAAVSLYSGANASTIETGQSFSELTLTVTNVNDGVAEILNLDGSAILLVNNPLGVTLTNGLTYSVSVVGSTATISLSGGSLSATELEALVDGISYRNLSTDPNTSDRVVTITSLKDNGGTANSGDDTAALTLSSTVTMQGVNNEPGLSATATDPTFTEGGAAVNLYSGASASDLELGQAVTDLTLTVTNVNDASAEVINIDGTAITLTNGNAGTTAGNTLLYSVSVVGSTATVSLVGGTMTGAQLETLVNNMSYQNNSDDPDTSNRVVTLTGLKDNGGTANGGDDTAVLGIASTVTVVGVNDEPTLTATASNPTFTEGGAAQTLFSGSTADTIETGQAFSELTLTVSNVNNGSAEVLTIDGTAIALINSSGTTATNGLSYNVSISGTTATITLSGGSLSATNTETLVDGISYQNTSNDPTAGNRVVTLTSLQDNGGTANGGDDTAALSIASTVAVVAVNDEPTFTATGSNPTFTEGGAAQNLFSGTSVDVIESGQVLGELTLTISNVNNGSAEILNIDGTAIALINSSGTTASNSLSYSVSVSGTTATVTLSGGSLSAAATETLVDSISYQNNSNDPNTSNRVVTITSFKDNGGTANGGDDSIALSIASTVTVVTVNDEPTLTATASNPTFTEGGGGTNPV